MFQFLSVLPFEFVYYIYTHIVNVFRLPHLFLQPQLLRGKKSFKHKIAKYATKAHFTVLASWSLSSYDSLFYEDFGRLTWKKEEEEIEKKKRRRSKKNNFVAPPICFNFSPRPHPPAPNPPAPNPPPPMGVAQ